MLPYGPTWSKMVQNGPKWSFIVQDYIKWSNGQQFLNLSKYSKKKFKIVQNGQHFSKWSIMVRYCPKRFKIVQKSFKVSTNFPKWSNKVQINFKLFQKITSVGVTAVGVTAVRNNLKL